MVDPYSSEDSSAPRRIAGSQVAGSADRPLPPSHLTERVQQITGRPYIDGDSGCARELGYSLDRSRSTVPTPPPIRSTQAIQSCAAAMVLLECCATVHEAWRDAKPQVSVGM